MSHLLEKEGVRTQPFFFVGWFRENLKSNQPPGKGDSYRKPSLLGAMLVSGKVGLNSFLLLVGFVKI